MLNTPMEEDLEPRTNPNKMGPGSIAKMLCFRLAVHRKGLVEHLEEMN